MSVPQNGKIAQESYPPARAILRGFIHWHTLYVPSGWFLYHSIVLSWYSWVQVSMDWVHQGIVSSRNRWTKMNHVQKFNMINMYVQCTDRYRQCTYNDEHGCTVICQNTRKEAALKERLGSLRGAETRWRRKADRAWWKVKCGCEAVQTCLYYVYTYT